MPKWQRLKLSFLPASSPRSEFQSFFSISPFPPSQQNHSHLQLRVTLHASKVASSTLATRYIGNILVVPARPGRRADTCQENGLSFRLRSRAALELELLAIRHQVSVLRRQHKGRLRLFSTDRLLWVWLYRIWPRCLDAMVLVKPATVIQWHRNGFRLYWRRRSRPLGRPKKSTQIRDLIRRMSMANGGRRASTANRSGLSRASPHTATLCRHRHRLPRRDECTATDRPARLVVRPHGFATKVQPCLVHRIKALRADWMWPVA